MAVFVCSQTIYATEATEEGADLNSSDLQSESRKTDQDLTIMLQAVPIGHDQKVKISDRIWTEPADDKVLLTAIATGGKPPYIYRWTKDGSDIADATEAFLVISYVSIDDQGVYTVRVTDSTGISVNSVVGFANRFDSWAVSPSLEEATTFHDFFIAFIVAVGLIGGVIAIRESRRWEKLYRREDDEDDYDDDHHVSNRHQNN